jgi:hypothetical protein
MKNEPMNNVKVWEQSPVSDLQSQVTVEGALYIVIGAVALALRLYNLGGAPLSNSEAHGALSAWRYTMDLGTPLVPVSATWFLLTSIVFTFFGASEFWARFVPALAGTALVFAPCTFRRELGRGAALIASGLLALSPVLTMASRSADGATWAALSLWLIVVGWRWLADADERLVADQRRGAVVAGLGLGLGLVSGPHFLSAGTASLLALLFMGLARRSMISEISEGWSRLVTNGRWLLLTAVAAFASVAMLPIGTPGLTAAGAAFPAWLGGWTPTAESRLVYLIPQMLFVYEPSLVVLGLGGLIFALVVGLQGLSEQPWRNTVGLLGAASIGALLFGLLYTGRSAYDALWPVFPLAMLVGVVVAEVFGGAWFEGEPQIVGAQGAVLFVMLVFAYLNVGGYARGIGVVTTINTAFDPAPYLRLIIAGGVIALGLFVTALFGAGWSPRSALRGMVMAVGAATLVGTIGAGWGLTQLRATSPLELWEPVTTAENIRLLKRSIEDIADRTVGNKTDLEVTVLNDPVWNDRDGLLAWELRDFTQVKFVDTLGGDINSPVVITEASISDPKLGSSYVGQQFPVFGREQLQTPALERTVDWWLFRSGGVEYSRKVLWVRQDVQTLADQNAKP